MTEKRVQSRSLSSSAALAKLNDTAQVVRRRGGLKPSEFKRVHEAVVAFAEPRADDVYEAFLRKVSDEAGFQMAILCAIALGRTAIKALKDRVRVDLPFEIKDRKSAWENAVIEQIVHDEMQTTHIRNATESQPQIESVNTETDTARVEHTTHIRTPTDS